MSWTLVHTSAASSDGNSVTTPGLNTTGADLLIVVTGHSGGGTSPTLSDSNSNTWIAQTLYPTGGGSVGQVRIYRCRGGTVGAGHTVTLSGSGSWPAVAFYALTGSATSPFDAENGVSSAASSPAQPGSITPAGNGEVFISGICSSSGDTQSFGVNASFSIDETVQPNFAQNVALVTASLIQTTGAAVNPQWSWTSTPSDQYSLTQAAYLPSSGGGGGGAAVPFFTTLGAIVMHR